MVLAYGGIRRSPWLRLRYLLLDRELDNFTYDIDNQSELSRFIAASLGVDAETVLGYLLELEDDRELADAIRARLKKRSDRNSTMPFGRRLGWYAIARIRRPKLIIETGVHDGLGSTALLRAVQRNASEGHEGELVSFDVASTAGWLIPDWLRSYHKLVIGNALTELPAAIGDRPVGLFIHDSDHRYAHETAEFDLISARTEPGSVLLSDNAHGGTAFRDFCKRRGLEFRFWKEVPMRHFYPGAGIGLAVVDSELRPDE
jgi:hypothetical protein